MKKLCKKGTVHPSPPIKSDDQFLSLLPVAILSLVAALSTEDREVLAYLITNSGDPNHFKKNKTNKEDYRHSPLFLCDCFSCYMSYWVRWDSSPNRQLIHEIIDAYEDNLEMMEKKKNNNYQKSKKDRKKRSGRVDSIVSSRLSELGSSSSKLDGGDSVKDGSCGGKEAEKEKGTVEKIMSFIGQKVFGVWG